MSAQEDAIIVALTEAAGTVWKPLSLSDGTWGPELAADESLTELLLKEGSQRMIGTGFVGDHTRYHFLDPAVQAGWEWTERVFGFQRVRFVSAFADFSRFIVEVMGPKSGYAYFVSDVKEHLTVPIGKIYAGATEIAEVRPIKYPAGDGLEIPAYLTLPPGRPVKNLPVIVFPHGVRKPATSPTSIGGRRYSRRKDMPYYSRTTADLISESVGSRPATANGAARCRPLCPTD